MIARFVPSWWYRAKMIRAYVAGDYPLAIRSAEKYLNWNRNSVSALWTIADSYRLLKNCDRAISYGEKAFSSDPKHIDTLQLLTDLYFEKRDYHSAYEYVCKAITVSEETERVLKESVDWVTRLLPTHIAAQPPTGVVRNVVVDEQERMKEWIAWAVQFKAWYENMGKQGQVFH